ncbi:MAG: hypothetical protein RLZZ299_873 [Pseudomonadota bacterium]|jgi:hypothetical protein
MGWLGWMLACAGWEGFRFVQPETLPLVGTCAAESDATVLYADQDGDGVGSDASAARGCLPADGWVAARGDCDDEDPLVHAGAPERCNGADDDCDAAVDEIPARIWCRDEDSDGFGDPDDGIHACAQPSHYVEECTDCDDGDAAIGGGCGAAADSGR